MEIAGPEVPLWSPLGLVVLTLLVLSAPGTRFAVRSVGASATLSGDVRAWLSALRGVWPVGDCVRVYNAAFILLTSFAAGLFADRGAPVAEAAWLASLPMWSFSYPFPEEAGLRRDSQAISGRS